MPASEDNRVFTYTVSTVLDQCFLEDVQYLKPIGRVDVLTSKINKINERTACK